MEKKKERPSIFLCLFLFVIPSAGLLSFLSFSFQRNERREMKEEIIFCFLLRRRMKETGNCTFFRDHRELPCRFALTIQEREERDGYSSPFFLELLLKKIHAKVYLSLLVSSSLLRIFFFLLSLFLIRSVAIYLEGLSLSFFLLQMRKDFLLLSSLFSILTQEQHLSLCLSSLRPLCSRGGSGVCTPERVR